MSQLLEIFKFCARLIIIVKDIFTRLKYWGLKIEQEHKDYQMCKVAWKKMKNEDWSDKHPPIE